MWLPVFKVQIWLLATAQHVDCNKNNGHQLQYHIKIHEYESSNALRIVYARVCVCAPWTHKEHQ